MAAISDDDPCIGAANFHLTNCSPAKVSDIGTIDEVSKESDVLLSLEPKGSIQLGICFTRMCLYVKYCCTYTVNLSYPTLMQWGSKHFHRIGSCLITEYLLAYFNMVIVPHKLVELKRMWIM